MEQPTRWERFLLILFREPIPESIRYPEIADYPLYLKDDGEGHSQGWVVRQILKILTPLERKVIIRHFGLNGQKPMTLREIVKDPVVNGLGVSRTRIGQIKSRALRKCRHPNRKLILSPYFYQPTELDKRVTLARQELCDLLCNYYPPDIAFEIAKNIKRRYLRDVFQSLQKGEKSGVALSLAVSCRVAISRCLYCQTPTIPGWTFCSKECHRAYNNITLICDGCGQEFTRNKTTLVYRLNKRGHRHVFHNRRCCGKWHKNRPRGS